MSTLEKAIEIAVKAHQIQTDKNDVILNKTIIAAVILVEEDDLFEVHLINLSDRSLSRVVKYTGSTYEGMSSNTHQRQYENFQSNTALQVDESDLGELDFNIWYVFDLYVNDDVPEQKPIRFSLSVNWHYVYQENLIQLPVLNKMGRILKFDHR